MPPPPVTPSPHRFVIKKERAIRKPPLVHPQDQTPRPSTQQFNATPRFTFSSTPRPTPSQNLPRTTPAPSRYLTPANKVPKKEADSIETSFEESSQDVHKSIESFHENEDAGYTSADLEDDYKLEKRTPKRRRLSPSLDIEQDEEPFDRDDNPEDKELDDNLFSSLPILSSPPAPRRPISTTAPRFLFSTPAPPSTPHSTSASTHAFLKPPRFRPPDLSEQAQAQGDPLPEQFSPHRKGEKYVPGGLAAEVRDWLVNIESALPTTSAQRSREDPWLVKIVIGEVGGNSRAGMTLIRGFQLVDHVGGGQTPDSLGVMKVILAGEGAGTGLQRGSKVEVGKTVGIKGPLWEVLFEGEKWGVGVDWKVFG